MVVPLPAGWTVQKVVTPQSELVDDFRAELARPNHRKFLDWYDALPRGGGSVPSREDILPEDIPNLLEGITIYSFDADGEPVFQLVGSRPAQAYTVNPKGRRYRDFLPPSRLESGLASFTRCRQARCGMFVRLLSVTEAGKARQTAAIGLPFRSRDGDGGVTRMVFYQEVVSQDFMFDRTEMELSFQWVLCRIFLDIGNGVPKEHEDIVVIPKKEARFTHRSAQG